MWKNVSRVNFGKFNLPKGVQYGKEEKSSKENSKEEKIIKEEKIN